ncbi:hypothetical protein [Nocardioides sp. cx-173]|uniref:hypothetical protein n=1 Tax=Nocardioides sp. cx-173 TaxID=2898796 RepID=UPI001E57F418|nr:hypothetical protein [Nocardioides sp. cx-173]MCD4527231.1 hypothetical protein [Nocardioides sp. cx-173]UGB40390.1 hypothetical protein LQ940_13475 [Nocardioides sp. cx-173]
MSTALQVDRRPRWGWAVGGVGAAVLAGIVVWYVNSPEPLPTSERTVTASTAVGRPVYVGVFAPTADFTRRLSLSGVKVHTAANTDVDVVPLLCQGGGFGVTSEPETFCEELVDPEGRSFAAGDSIVLKVSGDEFALAVIDRVKLGYRDGLQWATHEAGSDAVVRIVAPAP